MTSAEHEGARARKLNLDAEKEVLKSEHNMNIWRL
jgi:hypothetical protein